VIIAVVVKKQDIHALAGGGGVRTVHSWYIDWVLSLDFPIQMRFSVLIQIFPSFLMGNHVVVNISPLVR
jgi:hypothetical protein